MQQSGYSLQWSPDKPMNMDSEEISCLYSTTPMAYTVVGTAPNLDYNILYKLLQQDDLEQAEHSANECLKEVSAVQEQEPNE